MLVFAYAPSHLEGRGMRTDGTQIKARLHSTARKKAMENKSVVENVDNS